MSSRLLTMKFMQRAAASPGDTKATETNSELAEERPTKKQRLSNGVSLPESSTKCSLGPAQVDGDQDRLVVDFTAAELAKREAALDRLARDKGETKWTLSTSILPQSSSDPESELTIRTVGLGEIDAFSEEESEELGFRGRRTFGKPVQTRGLPGTEEQKHKSPRDDNDSDANDSSGTSDHEREHEDVDEMIQSARDEASGRARKQLKERSRERNKKSAAMAKERRGKSLNLNVPKRGGISSGGGTSGTAGPTEGSNKHGKRRTR